MKTRLDQPHLDPLRYDYQILRDAYEQPNKGNSVVEGIAYIMAIVLIVGFLARAIYVASQNINGPFSAVARIISEVTK